ncbi:MAG TPA: VOC family protein [Nocardioidaceae bacterium]|nr:VOC family protein [Nocardioidaceae bacterium]
MVKAIPEDYPRVVPYLHIDGAGAAIDFYTEVLGATERMRMPGDTADTIGHAELQIGDALIMLADEAPDMDIRGPKTVGGTPVTICLYVDDVDVVMERATSAGARILRPVENQFYGDRTGTFEDPFGHHWSVMTHVEDVDPDEMRRRMAEMTG